MAGALNKSLPILLALAATVLPGQAEEAGKPAILSLELNALAPSDTSGGESCRLTFVANNTIGRDISRIAYEVAVFGTDGMVNRLTVLDFKALPDAKTKVRQFDLAGTACANIGRVLINDASACEGDGLEPADCTLKLKTTSRSGIAFSQ